MPLVLAPEFIQAYGLDVLPKTQGSLLFTPGHYSHFYTQGDQARRVVMQNAAPVQAFDFSVAPLASASGSALNARAGSNHSMMFTGIQAFNAQMTSIKNKADQLRAEGNVAAADVADVLHTRISSHAAEFFASRLNERAFKEDCGIAIKAARPELEQFGWKEILGNLALAILGLGVVYLAACFINKVTTGHFLFFRPDAAEKLDGLEQGITGLSAAIQAN